MSVTVWVTWTRLHSSRTDSIYCLWNQNISHCFLKEYYICIHVLSISCVFLLHSHLLILCACIRVWVCVHGTFVEIRGKLQESVFSHHVVPGTKVRTSGLTACLCLLGLCNVSWFPVICKVGWARSLPYGSLYGCVSHYAYRSESNVCYKSSRNSH